MKMFIRWIVVLICILPFTGSFIHAGSTVKATHNAGFFSCCSVRLSTILEYFNENGELPLRVDSSKSFAWYKPSYKRGRDITYDYFKSNTTDEIAFSQKIKFDVWDDQFCDYRTLDYESFHPFIKKYFSPSPEISQHIEFLENKYNLEDYENICVLFHRGNDKITETRLCSYDEIIEKAKEIQQANPHVIFLIQSDETEFIEQMTQEFPNSFYFEDEIRHIRKNDRGQVDLMNLRDKNKNFHFSKYYLAITIIMSKCGFIVCGSGNCSLWIMFYRNHADNVYQYLNGVWFTP